MKRVLTALLLTLSWSLAQATPATATGQPAAVPAPGRGPKPAATPVQNELRSRSLQVALYLTDALRLTEQQARVLRRATLRELQQTTTKAQARKKSPKSNYDATMKRMLSAEQYAEFKNLKARKPVADLLGSPLAGR